jgi:archaeal flagellar protein FlaJ
MSSSKSSQKPANKDSFEPISAFDLFYQMTYMSAMAAAGISRTKTFEIAAQSKSKTQPYFFAINRLVTEFRLDYPEACRKIGVQAKSENMKSFLMRLADAMRSGEPLAEFLTREAEVQGQEYQNEYERNLEAMKQWTNAFSSITISVSLIIIIQVISSMIYSTNVGMMGGLVATGVALAGFGAWIIQRSAPREVMVIKASDGSPEQKRALALARILIPLATLGAIVLIMLGLPIGFVFIGASVFLIPVGILFGRADAMVIKKDLELSTFLRSLGGTATASGTTVKQALTRIDLSSFIYLQSDIERLSNRLQAMVDPEICWHKFGTETGSRLITEVSAIFYGGIKIGGDPEKVGYICSLFSARTVQLRAKRRLIGSTFTGLTTVMQAVVAGIMVFVISIVQNFAALVITLMPKNDEALESAPRMSLGMAEFAPGDLEFLATVTMVMIILLAIVSAAAIIFTNGGSRLKIAMYLAMTIFVSGVCYIVVPPMVASILTI